MQKNGGFQREREREEEGKECGGSDGKWREGLVSECEESVSFLPLFFSFFF